MRVRSMRICPRQKPSRWPSALSFTTRQSPGSWLKMIEIEFSAIVRECLKRRIPTLEQLEKEVLALVKERAKKKIKINWQYSIESARTKLNRHYQQVFADNIQYKKT